MTEKWKEAPLDEVADILSTRMSYSSLLALPERHLENGYVNVLGIKVADMNRSGSETFISNTALERLMKLDDAHYYCAPPEVIVFPKNGAAVATNKKRRVKHWSVFDPNIMGLHAKNSLSQNYLFYWMQNFDLASIISPGPVPHFNKSDLARVIIRHPISIVEQDEIAQALDYLTLAIKINTDAINKSQELKRSAMHELFTLGLHGEEQKETEIGVMPESWVPERLDQKAEIISTRMAYTELEKELDSKEPDAFTVLGIKVSDMNSLGNEVSISHAALTKKLPKALVEYRCAPPGTIIFPKRGAAIATNKKRITTTWTVFDPNIIGVIAQDKVDQRFLFQWFQNFDLKTITEPGPTPQLNKKNLEPLIIPVPPTLDEQCEIVKILNAIDRKIDLHKRKKAVLEELFKSLLHKLMTGEIRVSDLDLSAVKQTEAA